MNCITFRTQFDKVEFLAKKAARFKKGWEISLCPKQKRRLAWDHYCATIALKREKTIYVQMADKLVGEEELINFLMNQDLPIQL